MLVLKHPLLIKKFNSINFNRQLKDPFDGNLILVFIKLISLIPENLIVEMLESRYKLIFLLTIKLSFLFATYFRFFEFNRVEDS